MEFRENALVIIKSVADQILAAPFENQEFYKEWLAQTYYFVRFSTPMLALSAGRAVSQREYHYRCIAHLAEEKGHERMLLNDLKQFGSNIADFEELPAASALYQTQFYWIEHVGPTSFLGYILLLEGIAVLAGKEIMEKVASLPGTSFLKVHAEEDPDHLEKAFDAIEKLSTPEQAQVLKNLHSSAHHYKSLIAMVAEKGKQSDVGLSPSVAVLEL